ncbi:polyprenyl synthetase family protein [Salibacterium sp. K-3]
MSAPTTQTYSFRLFMEQLFDRLDTKIKGHKFSADQQRWLTDYYYQDDHPHAGIIHHDIFILFYQLAAHHRNGHMNDQLVDLGAFYFCYFASADLIDDVQDGDLQQGGYNQADAPVVINTGLTYLLLSLEFLREAMEKETSPQKAMHYFRLLNRLSLLAVKGQHNDLTMPPDSVAATDVLEINKEKSSNMQLLVELAAIHNECSAKDYEKYQQVAEWTTQHLQLINDLNDVFGKHTSLDVQTNKAAYPTVVFYEHASAQQLDTFKRLNKALPESLGEIRHLFYQTGVIERVVQQLEMLQTNIHDALRKTNGPTALKRNWLNFIDRTTAIYGGSQLLWPTQDECTGEDDFSSGIAAMMQEIERLCSALVSFPGHCRPWRHPVFHYEPRQHCLYYPDLGTQPQMVIETALLQYHHEDQAGLETWLHQSARYFVLTEGFRCVLHRHEQKHVSGQAVSAEAHELAQTVLQQVDPSYLKSLIARTRSLWNLVRDNGCEKHETGTALNNKVHKLLSIAQTDLRPLHEVTARHMPRTYFKHQLTGKPLMMKSDETGDE